VLAEAIPASLGAEKLREAVALRGEVGSARRFDVSFANWPQGGNVGKFVGDVQEK
jgi:hypothetical protein